MRTCGSWCEVQGSVQQYKRKAKDKLFKEELQTAQKSILINQIINKFMLTVTEIFGKIIVR